MIAQIPGWMEHRAAGPQEPALLSGIADTEGVPVEWAVAKRLYRILGKSFHPRPLDASGLLFRATFPGEKTLPGHDFTNGWRNLFARVLNVVHETGDHISIVQDEQHLAALAREINAVLDQYGSGK